MVNVRFIAFAVDHNVIVERLTNLAFSFLIRLFFVLLTSYITLSLLSLRQVPLRQEFAARGKALALRSFLWTAAVIAYMMLRSFTVSFQFEDSVYSALLSST